jgi:hypothetical protein
MHTDRCGNIRRQKCRAKGSGQETKMQEYMYRDATNVEHEVNDCTSNNWSQRNSNKRFKEKLVSHTRKTLVDSLQKLL